MSLQEKQEYLRTNIVDLGIDPEKFSEFWETFGIDFRDATFDDVVSVVAEFKTRHSENQTGDQQFGDYVQPENHDDYYKSINWDFLTIKPQHPKPLQIHEQQLLPELSTPSNQQKYAPPNKHRTGNKQKKEQGEELVQNEKKMMEKVEKVEKVGKNEDLLTMSVDQNVNNVSFQQVIKESEEVKRKCLKLQPNILEHHTNVEIYITKFKQITDDNPGIVAKLWKATYLLFTIKTIGRNKHKAIGISWEVSRQHSDFQWLRNTLVKMYPGLVVPPLPSLVSSKDKLNGYQRKLEGFLLDCYNCPELRNSKYFEKDLQTFKKTCESTSKPKSLHHILNMQGQLSLLHGEKLNQYSQGLQQFLQKTSQHLKNVKNIIKQIDESYSQISQRYKELSEVFITMSEESCQFSQEECYPRLTQTYHQISQLVAQHSYFSMMEKEFLETFLHSHFAYEKDRVDNMQNLISKRKIFVTEFAKPKHQGEKPTQSGTSMFGKIAGLFGEKTESLDLASSDTSILKEQVGFYNSQLIKQSIRCIQGMIQSHVNHFSAYGLTRIDNVQSMQKLWSKILVELSKLKAR